MIMTRIHKNIKNAKFHNKNGTNKILVSVFNLDERRKLSRFPYPLRLLFFSYSSENK